MLSQQAQDVAVSLQMGMSASRVIAQQGSQIASIFGTKGMVIGGVIAIGAAIAEWAMNTKAAEKAAEEYKKVLDETAEIAKKNDAGRIEMAAKIAAAARGEEAGARVAEELKYEKELNEIHQKEIALVAKLSQDKEKARKESVSRAGGFSRLSVAREAEALAASGIGRALSKEESQLRELAERKKQMAGDINIDRATRNKKKEAAIDFSVWSTNQQAAMLEIESEEERKYAQLEHDFKSDLFQIEMSEESDAQKMKRIYAAENLYAAKLEAAEREKEFFDSALYLKSAEEQVRLTSEKTKAEKDASQFRDTSAQKYLRIQSEISALEKDYNMGRLERETKIAQKKLELLNQEEGAMREIESMRREGVEFALAGLAGSDAQNKRKAIEMEMDLLNKKKAFSPIEAQQIANKLELLRREQVNENFNMGGMGAGGMGAFNRNRKAQERAQDMAERRALENMGLIGIQKGVGGEIIAGTDPVTGRKLTKDELAKRKADMAAEKMRRDMERKAAAGDKEAQERLKRVRWGNEGGNDGKIAAGFSEDQIKFLSTSIADAVKELIAK
jgi:hypothetical protein